jgi:glutamyl/glutaminyl-tRNA synthetase
MEMGVTHVIRGQDHISNTARQILIGEAIGATTSHYAHIPLILSPDKHKLSKRHGAVSALEYRDMGYLPQALLNFVALIGWNPGTEKEIFTPEELISEFSLERVQKSGGVFNIEKLNWINKEHIKLLPSEEIKKNILEWLPEKMQDKKIAPKLVPLIFERISKWGDVKEMADNGELDFFFKEPKYSKDKLIFKSAPAEKIKNNLEKAIEALKNIGGNDFTKENVKISLMKLSEDLESRGELLHPVRYALSGLDQSPDPFTIAEILGKDETISRLQKAI